MRARCGLQKRQWSGGQFVFLHQRDLIFAKNPTVSMRSYPRYAEDAAKCGASRRWRKSRQALIDQAAQTAGIHRDKRKQHTSVRCGACSADLCRVAQESQHIPIDRDIRKCGRLQPGSMTHRSIDTRPVETYWILVSDMVPYKKTECCCCCWRDLGCDALRSSDSKELESLARSRVARVCRVWRFDLASSRLAASRRVHA